MSSSYPASGAAMSGCATRIWNMITRKHRIAVLAGAALLLTGAGDPFSNAHSEDESVDLKDLERSTLAEALFFDYLASK